MNRTIRTLQWLLPVLGILNISCDEVFPLYTEPTNVLSTELSIGKPDTLTVFYDGLSDSYSTSPALTMSIKVTNVYDDLLQGDAFIGDRLVLQAFGTTPEVIIVPITLGSLRFPSVFRGTIALPPKKSADFQVPFLPVPKNNRPVYRGMSYIALDSAKLYGPIEFIANAEIRLFQRVQSIRSNEYRFKLYFKEYEVKRN
jgi:hypothetical protein